MYYLKRFDYLELAGVETSRPRADYAQNLLSLQVQRDYYNGGMILGKKWSCISLFHVLEHIDGPFVLLENLIGGAVEQDGMIYIEVPNYYSISSVIAGDYWAHFTPHFHTNHFTVRSLTNLCVNSLFNFKVVGTFSFYNGILGMLSAILRVFNYRGSIFEDLKSRKVPIIVLVFFLSPIALLLEFAGSVIFKRGSVIKLIIWRK